jgi:hypothetical protein
VHVSRECEGDRRVAIPDRAAPGSPAGANARHEIALLLVFLDDRGWADVRLIRILPGVAQRAPLSEQIPALIELDLDRLEAHLPVVIEVGLPVQRLFFVDEVFDVPQHAGVSLVSHDGSPLDQGNAQT